MNAFVIGAATSGSGKTIVTMGLLRAFANLGLKVQPYKCGPDYIDSMLHTIASGEESINLDTWMASEAHARHLFNHYGKGHDLGIVEGVMGLYDGYDKSHGSSGDMAVLLDIPVILVINAKAAAYSVAPIIHGLKTFTPASTQRSKVVGVIFNMVSSEKHFAELKAACEDAGVPCLGYVTQRAELQMSGRHFGLTTERKEEIEKMVEVAADEVEKHVELNQLIDTISSSTNFLNDDTVTAFGTERKRQLSELDTKRFAVANDAAFNFTYRANIDTLKRMGEVVFFSPLSDRALPICDSLYLPGGFTELFATELSRNISMRQSIKSFAERGGQIFAECGGFVYLCNSLHGDDGTIHPMCGILPLDTTMENAHLHLGYRMMKLGGKVMRGHEFHYSSVMPTDIKPDGLTIEHCQYSVKGAPVDTPIYRYKNVVAGYTHWYWGEKEV